MAPAAHFNTVQLITDPSDSPPQSDLLPLVVPNSDSKLNRKASGQPGTSAARDACAGHAAPRIALAFMIILLVAVISQLLDGDRLAALIEWIDEKPLEGSMFFMGIDIVAVSVMFPGAILNLAAGAVFGVVKGSCIVWVGTSIGQTIAFTIGRYLLRDAVMDFMTRKYPKWVVIDQALSKEGWKLIPLLRLSPIVPWNVLNYALSITGVNLVPYIVSSAVSIIPWTISFVYFGSLAHTMADIIDGKAGPDSGTTLVFVAISGVLIAVVVCYTTIIARRAIKEALHNSGPAGSEIADELDSFSVMASPRSDILSLRDSEFSPLRGAAGGAVDHYAADDVESVTSCSSARGTPVGPGDRKLRTSDRRFGPGLL
ncbi:hypothetical protein WJX72_011081 [[Myrmecia] bisecta]|uniref:VTT domain-containing protein n=1 Tax=[Myrmecia] bisecta TaxID=41462 RepID=A0AAW1P8N2_9CHLO